MPRAKRLSTTKVERPKGTDTTVCPNKKKKPDSKQQEDKDDHILSQTAADIGSKQSKQIDKVKHISKGSLLQSASAQTGNIIKELHDSPVKKLAQRKANDINNSGSSQTKANTDCNRQINTKNSPYFDENGGQNVPPKGVKRTLNKHSDKSSVSEATHKKIPKVDILKEEISLISDSESDSDFEEVSFIAASPKNEKAPKKANSTQKGAGKKSSKADTKKSQRTKSGAKAELDGPETDTRTLPILTDADKRMFENADESNIKDMLLAFEKNHPVIAEGKKATGDGSNMKKEESDSDSDWEEVEVGDDGGSPMKKDANEQGTVQITLEAPNIMRKKRKKKGFDLEDWFRLQVNRYKKESQLELHKVHLLCLLSHGCHRNRLCREPTLMAVALSLVPIEIVAWKKESWDLLALNKLMKWFLETFHIDADLKELKRVNEENLMQRLADQKVASEVEIVMMYVLTVRSLGLDARIVYSLQPVTHKASDLKLKKKVTNDEEEEDETAPKEKTKISSTNISTTCNNSSHGSSNVCSKSQENKTNKSSSMKDSQAKKQTKSKKSNMAAEQNINDKPENCPQTQSAKDLSVSQTKKNTSSTQTNAKQPKTKNTRPRTCASKVTYNETVTLSDELSSEEDLEVVESEEEEEEKVKQTAKTGRNGKKITGKKKSGGTKGKSHKKYAKGHVQKISSDEEFDAEKITYRSPSLGSRSKAVYKLKAKGSKVVSSDSDDSVEIIKSNIKEKGRDCWAEVYLQGKQKWICVDCVKGRVNHPSEMEAQATQPMYYVLGYDINGRVKDLTRKYARNWMSSTRKLRVDDEWWQIALLPYRPLDAERDSMEDLEIQANLMKKPLPTTISEYKNHPLYALKRHLLKFEALYPDTAVPLGYIRKEPVYARECVHTLHSRQNWLKEARLVRVKEAPYKLVKARMTKKRAALMDGPEEPTLELYGYWQTEEYIPPPAYNGKVPRNEYGNVELFKPCMLPGGTVHLKGMPGLNRVAKKLNLDCVAAMTGWDSHGGYSHPVLDGWVVCEEHKDTLLAAWDEEQEIIREREEEKRMKRILSNWTLLVKGKIIKERLKERYDLKDPEEQEKETEKKSRKAGSKANKKTEKATDAEVSWPRNLQNKSKTSTKKTDKSVPFPFEVEEL